MKAASNFGVIVVGWGGDVQVTRLSYQPTVKTSHNQGVVR